MYLTYELMGGSHRTHYSLLKPASWTLYPRLINGTIVLVGVRIFPWASVFDIPLRPVLGWQRTALHTEWAYEQGG